MPDSGKKLEHMKDEPDVMVFLLLSLKDRNKIGRNTSIVTLLPLNSEQQADSLIRNNYLIEL